MPNYARPDEIIAPHPRLLLSSILCYRSFQTHQCTRTSKLLQGHRTMHLLRLSISPPCLMVRNHYCGCFFHLPIPRILPSFTRSSRRTPRYYPPTGTRLSHVSNPLNPTASKAAFTRRAITVACVELVDPPHYWGLRDDSLHVREDTTLSFDHFSQIITLCHSAFVYARHEAITAPSQLEVLEA